MNDDAPKSVWKLEAATTDPNTGGPYWWAIYEFDHGNDINGRSVAYIWPGSFNHRHAFMAAPTMLAALKEAAGWFEEYSKQHYAKALTAPDRGEQHGRETKGKTNADRAKALRAAIALASPDIK